MRKLLIACVVLFSLAANYAFAATYNYTGQYFTDGAGVYEEGMSVSGSITTSSPIPPNSVDLDITPLITSWSFFDGVQTLSSANGDLLHQFSFEDVPPLSFSTDALGNIISADILVQDNPLPTTVGGTVSVIYSFGSVPVDAGLLDFVCITVVDDLCSEYRPSETGFAQAMSVGTWGPIKSATTSVPTMSVWGLGIFVALLGLIGFSRRRYI